MNPTVGDYAGNAGKILKWIDSAEREKSDIIVFPEIALSGYPVWDLANKKQFIKEGLKHLDRIIHSAKKKKIAVIIGFIDENKKKHKQSYNALAFIHRGKILTKYYKQLLPTYDVFLEEIFFEAGSTSPVIDWKGFKIGLSICEDIWDEGYEQKPLAKLKRKRANFIINISASPYYRDVSQSRDQLLKKHAIHYHTPILYVNQVGGQDDLIFDGRSLLVDAEGKILYRAPAFKEGLFYYSWSTSKNIEAQPESVTRHPEETYNALVLGLRDYCRKNNFKKVILGLSGGIDSTLVAALAVDALGPKAVTGVTMPSEFSSKGSWEDSAELAKRLGISLRVYPIKKKYQHMIQAFKAQKKRYKIKHPKKGTMNLAMENLQARLRGLELMYISNDEGRLLLTTGNKSELAMGYCTLYGDMAGGLCVIGDVYKTDVYKLCLYKNRNRELIPRTILDKPPSAELRPNQKDQDSLPAYDVLDEILYLYIEKNMSSDEIIDTLKYRKISARLIKEAIRKVDHNEYKRKQTPPVLRVTEKSWFEPPHAHHQSV